MSESLPLIRAGAEHTGFDASPLAATGSPRLARRIAWLVIAASGLYEVAYIWMWLQNTDIGTDYFMFWSAGRWMIERGLTAPLYDLDTFHAYQETLFRGFGSYHPLPYPPTFAPALVPLGWMPLAAGLAISMATTLALFLWLTAGGLKMRILALLSSPATLAVIIVGQIAFLSSALLIGGLRLVERGPIVAGVLFGLLSIKPQIGLLVPVALLAFRAWRAFAVAAIVTLLLPIPALLIEGPGVWAAWLHLMPAIASYLPNASESHVGQMVSPAAAFVTAGVPLKIAELIQLPISLAVIAVAYVSCRRHGLSDMTVAMLGVGTLLVTPYAWFYDLLIAAYAVVVLAEAGLRTGFRKWELPALLLGWVLPLLAIRSLVPGLATLGLVGLFVLLVRRMAEAPASEAAVTA